MKTIEPPLGKELDDILGGMRPLWDGLIKAVRTSLSPVETSWIPSKSSFGKLCVLTYKEHHLLYLRPDLDAVHTTTPLGEMACERAKNSDLPDEVKAQIEMAKKHPDGRMVRHAVTSESDVRIVAKLVGLKKRPKE
jgi:hypothetical protein